MNKPQLWVTSGLGSGARGEALKLLAATTTEQLDANDSAAFRVRMPFPVTVTLRTPMRFLGSDGLTREYYVRRLTRDPLGAYCDIEGAPPLHLLARAGLVRQTVGGVERISLGGTLTAAQWITNYVLTNLVADGIDGMLDTALGTIDSAQLVTLSFTKWTRLELLRALAEALGMELSLTQPSVGAKMRINLQTARNGSIVAIQASRGRNLLKLSIDSDDEGLATVVRPMGDVPDGDTEPASIANHVFTVASITSGWVVLLDGTTSALPIGIDDMANGLYLQFLNGTTVVRRAITDSRASDGAVFLADTSLLLVGASVTLVQDASGTPLTTLVNPAALATYGRSSVELSVSGMRGEANSVQNANFLTGASRWSAPSSGWLEPYVTSETSDLVGAMNGSKSAGAPPTLAVDGMTPGATVRRGERIEVASVLLATVNATKVIPSNGNLTLPLTGTLSQNVAAGASFRMYDSNGVSLFYSGEITFNGAQTAGATTLAVSVPGYGNRALTAGDQIRFNYGGNYAATLGTTDSYDNSAIPTPTNWNVILMLLTPLTNVSASPTSPDLATGAPVSVYLMNTGQYITATVGAASYVSGDYNIELNISVPANTLLTLPMDRVIVSAFQTSSDTRTITNSTTEWPDNKRITVTWTGGLTEDGATSIDWLTSGSALIKQLTGISGLTVSSTSAVLENSTAFTIPANAVAYSNPETLYCNAASIVNGAGVASIALQAANSVSLADNAVVRVVRNNVGWVDQGAGSTTLLRSSTGWITDECVIPVASGASKTAWAHFAGQFWFSGNDFTAGTAVRLRLDVVNVATGVVIGTVTSDPLPFVVPSGSTRPLPVSCVVKVQFSVSATTRVKLNAYPEVASGIVPWTTKGYAMGTYAMLTEGVDPNVPFTPQSHANIGFQAGVRYLKVFGRETRSIQASLVQLRDIVGATDAVESFVVGVSVVMREMAETLRLVQVNRDHFAPANSAFTFESQQASAARLIGTGSAVATGSGSVSSVSGSVGSGGSGGVVSSGVTLTDDNGASIAGVETIQVSGLGVAVAANGVNTARITIPSTIDPSGVDAVVSGGAWIARDLVTLPGYDVTIEAGTGLIAGRAVSWPQTTVVTTVANSIVYVDAAGVVRARAVTAPETLTTAAELVLYRTYVDVATYGNRIYAVAESRTFYRLQPRAPLFLKQRVQDSEVTSGTWNNAIAINSTGYINWYFANLGLYPFVEELPTLVKDHLDVQIAKFYGAGGTANSAPTWNSVHGTTWAAGFLRWPYDVNDPRGTPVVRRADSHDAYAATFLRLAARYAQIASGGLTWWDTNIAAIQDCAYYNLIVPVRLVNGGAGYLTDTFQHVDVYPFNQTLDNVESYRGLKDALDLMTSRGGAQATWAATYSGTPGNLLNGIQSQWSSSANAAGETEWLSVAYDKVAAVKLTNEMTRFYPDISIGVPAAIYDVPLGSTDAIARTRLDQQFRWLNAKAPTWFTSRKYDLYPWGMLAAAAAKVGFRDLAERWLAFVQLHHANDSSGYFLIHDIGWARYVERVLNGETLS